MVQVRLECNDASQNGMQRCNSDWNLMAQFRLEFNGATQIGM